MAAVPRPHIAVTGRAATRRPLWLMVPITVEAESAEVMKNVASRIIAMTDDTAPPGNVCSRENSWPSEVPSPQIDSPACSSEMAEPPKMENHTSDTTDGTITTVKMNSRMVRPREMRAMNMPTNGDQDTHQAQ